MKLQLQVRSLALILLFLGRGLGGIGVEAAVANWTVGQVVETSSGAVSGHAASNATGVSEYLGIPFAQPPVGDLRFAAPVAYNGSAAINASSFGFSCPALQNNAASPQGLVAANVTGAGLQILAALAQIGDKFSEDCLTLNVWTKPQVGEANKAVLVWIYGGGFGIGNSDNPGYNGQFIADQEDVVLVSFNYRLNIFGFPGSPSTPNNLGLLDQRLAVEWVRDNIAGFGGDPSRITLFGQSAGGASVDYYTYAWTSDPIVSGFIPESGTAVGLGQLSATSSAILWFNVSSTLGCGDATTNGSSVLSCMRTKNYTSILSSIHTSANSISASSSFGPTVDDKVVFSDYTSRSLTGNFIQRPMLIGNADYEAGLFKVVGELAGQFYSDDFWNTFNQQLFTCPASARANISIANGVPTWRYRWFGTFPNTNLTYSALPYIGAYHGSELPVLFDNAPSGEGIPPNTDAEIVIGSYLRGAWAAFAKDPVTGLGKGNYSWPYYAPGNDTLVRLAYGGLSGSNLAGATSYDVGCASTFPVIPAGNGTSGGGNGGGGSVYPSGSVVGSTYPSGTVVSSYPSGTAGVGTVTGTVVSGYPSGTVGVGTVTGTVGAAPTTSGSSSTSALSGVGTSTSEASRPSSSFLLLLSFFLLGLEFLA